MIKATASALITSPADRVFEFIGVYFFRNYRRWSPEVVSLRVLSKGPVRIGTTARQVRVDKGRRTEATFTVCAFEPGKRIDFRGVSDSFYISYRLEGSVDQTFVTFLVELPRLEFFMRPFERQVAAYMHKSAERVVRNIKDLIEAGAGDASTC